LVDEIILFFYFSCHVSCSDGFKFGREEERATKKSMLNVRIDHQVEFGENIVIVGSSKEMGSWKKKVPMKWTENGWVCKLELKGGEVVEFKFAIASKDNSLVWESGDNRALKLPREGSFAIVCRWGATGEAINFSPLELEQNGEEAEDVGENGSAGADITLEAGTSPFVGQWQGKAASFMRSNDHGNRGSERRWDTSGLQGSVLKLVEGDLNARNWRRKVLMLKCVLSNLDFVEIFRQPSKPIFLSTSR
jgi:phosphoglucan,water dikinase